MRVIPPPSIAASFPTPLASDMFLSSSSMVVELTVVVVPFTVKSPVTVRLSLTVVSDVVFPMLIAVALVVPIDIDAAPEPGFAASIVRALALLELAVIVRLVVSVESMDSVVPSTVIAPPFKSIVESAAVESAVSAPTDVI